MFCTVLTDEQIERIHNASLQILDKTGIVVPHDRALDLFEEAGAVVDRSNNRVRIPPELVMSSLDKSTKQYILYGRDKSKTAEFGYGKRNFNSSAGQALWIDKLGENRRRRPCVDDVISAARLADALERINITGAMAEPDEIPMEVRCVEVTAELIKNTTQPIHHWFHNKASAKYIVEMLIALRGSEKEAGEYPLCYPFLEPISPLQFPFDGIDVLFETSRIMLPVPIGPMAQTGSSAPATLAGTMALQNAEILAGMCITQLICPGTPICYGGICHAFDMKTTQIIFAGPEQAIFGAAMTQMGKRYGLPVYVNCGMTDSKSLDAQAGLEMGTTLLSAAAAGADIIGHMGICGADQGASLDLLVLQDQVISYVDSMLRQIEFSDETLALDEIDDCGPGGSFLAREHTVDHFRQELWFPEMADRQYYQQWLDSGAISMDQRCRDKKEELLQSHEVEPISDELARELGKIVDDARRHLLK